MILIPGLSSPAEVWDGTTAHFERRFECHRLTLAGFAGQKAIDGPLLPTVRRELAEYIRAKKLEKPVIIDESDDSLDAFPRAKALGYKGVSSKTCKGIYKSLVNRARCAAWGGEYFMTGEDLTIQPGLALQQDLALVSQLGLTHVERNGHHYVNGMADLPRGEQQAFLTAHPDLYEQSHGAVRVRIESGFRAPPRSGPPRAVPLRRAEPAAGGVEQPGLEVETRDALVEGHPAPKPPGLLTPVRCARRTEEHQCRDHSRLLSPGSPAQRFQPGNGRTGFAVAAAGGYTISFTIWPSFFTTCSMISSAPIWSPASGEVSGSTR